MVNVDEVDEPLSSTVEGAQTLRHGARKLCGILRSLRCWSCQRGIGHIRQRQLGLMLWPVRPDQLEHALTR